MKIAFLTDTFFPQINGVATSIANFATELGRRGHEVLIIYPKPKESLNWSAPNVRVVQLPSIPALVYPDFRISPFVGLPRVVKAISAFDPDIIHFHTTAAISLDAVVAAKLFGKPLIGTNHIYLTRNETAYLYFISGNEQVRRALSSLILEYSFSFYAFCDVRIAPSQLLIAALQQEGYKRSLTYLPNAVSVTSGRQLTVQEKNRLRKKYGLRGRVILHIGRLSAEKKIDDLLRAFALLAQRRHDVSLLMVGDGPDRKKLEAQARQHGIEKEVVITGFIPHDELIASGLPGVADVFVTMSTMESQGMVLLEAMAFHLPIVAARACAIPEVVGESGILVEPGDYQAAAAQIDALLTNESQRRGLAQKSFERLTYFSLTTTTDRLLQIYEQAITKSGE